jgi:hypothetical protein
MDADAGAAAFAWLAWLPHALTVLLQIVCALHALRTGRHYGWLFFILFFPFVGSVVYLAVEVWPDWRRGHGGGRPQARRGRRLLRELEADLSLRDTIDTRLKLARACQEVDEHARAADLYQGCLQGAYADDPAVLYRLAESRVALGEAVPALEALVRLERTGNRDYRKERTLLEARAREAIGEHARAIGLYRSIADTYPGEEARARLALLLTQTGDRAGAATLWRDIRASAARAGHAYRRREKSWLDLARRNAGKAPAP